jgi:cysteinyl-tRNA synthetase
MMEQIRLFNTLTRQVESFTPRDPAAVLMYTCGPTVYRSVHIGNLRSYLMAGWLRRTLERAGCGVRQVVNITDVGHMRQEQLDKGEDKVVAAALASGQTPGEIAAFYTEAYHRDLARLGIMPAAVYPRASEHVSEMIALIERLLEHGHAYCAGGTVYFSIASYPGYGALSGNIEGTDLEEGVRAPLDPHKRDPRDFALWKSAEPGRTLQWPSPWGPGFPGWHIECSAMSLKHLGESLDLHTGGVDNIFPHHEDERAQSEAASGKRFVGHWVHGQHLLVDGLKMAKSTGNAYTLDDLEARGFDPLAFRYLCLSVRYRHRMNFSFAALGAAQRALTRLRERVQATPPAPDAAWSGPWLEAFDAALADDLNLPAALGVLWKMLHAPGEERAKVAALLTADRVLGLGLRDVQPNESPRAVRALIQQRETLRAQGDYAAADQLREQVRLHGYQVRDTPKGTQLTPHRSDHRSTDLTRSEDVPSLLDESDTLQATIGLVVTNALDDLQRSVQSVLRCCDPRGLEVLVIDNGSTDGTREWLDERAAAEPVLRVLHTDHNLGEAAGRNAVLKQARGAMVVLVDTSIEFSGDPLPALRRALAEPGVGAAGGFGLATDDLRHFEETEAAEVDALEGYLLAMRRSVVREVGLMDEKYRFYRNLDIDYSFQIRDRGYRLARIPSLPLTVYPHRVWHSLSDEQREALSKKNFNRFLHRWRERTDLLRATPAAARHR